MTPHEAREAVKEITFKRKQVDEKKPPESDDYLPHWRLTFGYRGKQAVFDFWNDLENKPPEKIEALASVLDTATEGLGDVDEFFHQHKYEDRPTEGLKAYRRSQGIARRLKRWLGCTDEDLYVLAETANTMKPVE